MIRLTVDDQDIYLSKDQLAAIIVAIAVVTPKQIEQKGCKEYADTLPRIREKFLNLVK